MTAARPAPGASGGAQGQGASDVTDVSDGTDVGAALGQARALGLERLDAQLLLAQALQRPRAWLLAHPDVALPAPTHRAFVASCRLRADDVPLAYLLGEREFHGLMLHVDPAVLVPRPDTEILVDWALELLATPLAAEPEVADLGCGSGAIALALKHRHPSARLRAVDCSAAALQVARANAARHGLQVECLQGDWWQPLAGRRLHLAASNPPYVAEGDPHLPRLRHEPLSALTAGPDGLAALTRIVREAPVYLHDGAWLLLEHGHQQADAVRRLLADAGFDHVQSRVDLAGRLRCSGGRLGWAG